MRCFNCDYWFKDEEYDAPCPKCGTKWERVVHEYFLKIQRELGDIKLAH